MCEAKRRRVWLSKSVDPCCWGVASACIKRIEAIESNIESDSLPIDPPASLLPMPVRYLCKSSHILWHRLAFSLISFFPFLFSRFHCSFCISVSHVCVSNFCAFCFHPFHPRHATRSMNRNRIHRLDSTRLDDSRSRRAPRAPRPSSSFYAD